MQQQLFNVREKRNKGWFWMDNDYFNGFGKTLGAYAVAVYVSLCRHADNETQKCFPSQKEMAKELKMGERKIREIIKQFEKYRIIEVQKNKDYKGKWIHNTYWLLDKAEWIYPEAQSACGEPRGTTKQTQRHHKPTNKTYNTNKTNKNKSLTFRGQATRCYFGTYQVYSGGSWKNLDPKYIKEVVEI